jgi:hypothetical protein
MTCSRARPSTQISIALALLCIPRFVVAQEERDPAGVAVQIVVTPEPKHGNEVRQITQQDVIVNQGHDRRPVTGWVQATGPLSFAKILCACDFNRIGSCHPQAECDSTPRWSTPLR